LWSIPDLLGAQFTKEFCKSLNIEAGREKNNGGGSGLVNMAKAFQAAIIALDDNDLAHMTGFHLFCKAGGCTSRPW
jgi:hypothetical protein